jgi:hypothetical protein
MTRMFINQENDGTRVVDFCSKIRKSGNELRLQPINDKSFINHSKKSRVSQFVNWSFWLVPPPLSHGFDHVNPPRSKQPSSSLSSNHPTQSVSKQSMMGRFPKTIPSSLFSSSFAFVVSGSVIQSDVAEEGALLRLSGSSFPLIFGLASSRFAQAVTDHWSSPLSKLFFQPLRFQSRTQRDC